MVWASRVLQIVKKTTGGKAWHKPWGHHGLTKTQKANRSKQLGDERSVQDALREAAKREPAPEAHHTTSPAQ